MRLYIIFYSSGIEIYAAENKARAIELFKQNNPLGTWIDTYEEHIKELEVKEGYLICVPTITDEWE